MSMSPAAQVRHRIPRIAGAAVERARLTVVPRRRTRAARVPFVALVSALLVGGVVGLLLFNTSMQQAAFATTALEERAQSLSAREQGLRMDLERLRDPQVLATKAQRAGMVPPPPPCFLHADGTVEGTCTPAVAADALPIGPPAPVKPAVLDPDPVIVRAPATGAGTDAGTAAGADTRGDTSRGDAREGRGDGRTEQQQSQQSQESQQSRESQRDQQRQDR